MTARDKANLVVGGRRMRRVVSEENRRLTILPAVLRIHALARRSRRGDDGPARAERRRGLVRRTNQGRAVWGVRVRPKTGRWAAAHRKALLGGGWCAVWDGARFHVGFAWLRVTGMQREPGRAAAESDWGGVRRGSDRRPRYCMLREEYSVVGRGQGERHRGQHGQLAVVGGGGW